MTNQRFYPYRTSMGRIGLNVRSSRPELEMDPSRYLKLFETGVDEWSLEFDVDLPSELIPYVVPQHESADPPLALHVVFFSTSSRVREQLPVSLDGEHGLRLEISRLDFTGIVDVRAVLVRASEGEPTAGYAHARNAVLADSLPVRIEFDIPPEPPGKSLPIRWEAFSESTIPKLRDNADNLFALHAEAGNDPPTILLNRDVEGAMAVLTSTGRTGPRARSREAAFSVIVHQAWSSIISAVLGELNDVAGDDVSLEEALADLVDWMVAVLQMWAPHLYPEVPAKAAMESVYEEVSAGQWEDLLIDRLPVALQSFAQTQKAFAGMVKEYDL